MTFLDWIANHAIWITLLGLVIASCAKLEKRLVPWAHRLLVRLGLWISIVVPLLGLLKSHLDTKWRLEMQQAIANIKDAAKPRPFQDRLIECLNLIDPKILEMLAAGQTHFEKNLKPYLFADLQKLAEEPDAGSYISFASKPAIVRSQNQLLSIAVFDLNASLLTK